MVKFEFNPWLLFDAVGMRDHYPMVNVTGMQIKDALTRLGKTQSWLAEKMEVTDAAVHKWISTGEIGRDRLVDLARLLGLTVDQLLTGEPAKDTRLTDVVEALPESDRQMVLDFIQYRWERAEQTLVASEDKTRSYLAMMRTIINDLRTKKSPTP